MTTGALTLSRDDARRFAVGAQAIGASLSVGDTVRRLGFVQIDPINVCGRMHDHILRNRVPGYRPDDLAQALYPPPSAPRPLVEQHHPKTGIFAAFPAEAWPHLLAAMRRRSRGTGAWSGKLTPRERAMAERVFERLAQGGPVAPEDFADSGRARAVWGSATVAKATLQKLFFHGRLLIAGRRANRRLYDLPERLMASEVLALPEPSAAQTERWLVDQKLRQYRLVALSRAEQRLAADAVAVAVEGCPPLFCRREDLPLLDRRDHGPAGAVLLAPLDPLIYHRPLTRALWDFDYTWEAYTPPRLRKRGYYALPILSGGALVGHVDPAADTRAGRLRVRARRVRRGHATRPALAALASFLGLRL